MLSCLSRTACCNSGDLDGLLEAGRDCRRLSKETVDLCSSAQEKSRALDGFGDNFESTISSLKEKSLVDPSTYAGIQEFVEENQSRLEENMAVAREADDMAAECVTKSSEMMESMERARDSVPSPMRAALDDDNDEDIGEFEQEERLLENCNDNIEELETCTKSLERMNLLTATTSGKNAFGGLVANKGGEVCASVFEKIKDLASSVSSIMDAFVMKQILLLPQYKTWRYKQRKSFGACGSATLFRNSPKPPND